MSAAADYAYLHARVSVLSQRLLRKDQFELLIEQAASAEGGLLGTAGIPNLFADESADPSRIEQILITLLLDDFLVLMRPLSGVPRELLVYWARRFELSNIKAMIRGKLAGRAPTSIREELLDLGPFSTLDLDALLQTEDAAELLRSLEGTAYADIARQARLMFEEQNELFTLDAAVDKRYFAGLDKRANALQATDQLHLRPLVGSIIDRNNLVWLLRYRFAYDLAPAHAYYLLIPAGHHLGSQQLLSLVQLGSVEDVIHNLPTPLNAVLAEAASTTEVEHILEREIERIAATILQRTAFNVARAFAYLILRESQLLRVHALVKGKQLQLDEALIRAAVGVSEAVPETAPAS